MEILRLILLAAHLLGFAAVAGALFAQLSTEKHITPVIRWGARITFLAGLLLVGVLEADDTVTVDHMKVGIKLIIGLAILALAEANGKKAKISDNLYYVLLGLTVANVVVALFVTPTHGSY